MIILRQQCHLTKSSFKKPNSFTSCSTISHLIENVWKYPAWAVPTAWFPSIHLLYFYYPRLGHRGQEGPGRKLRHLSPQRHSPAPLRGSQGIPPVVNSGSAQGPPPSWMCPKKLLRQATSRYLNQMPDPPKLTPFDAIEQRLYSELPPDAPHLITKAETSHPPKQTHFSCRLYPWPHSIGHCPDLMTIGEVWKKDELINW